MTSIRKLLDGAVEQPAVRHDMEDVVRRGRRGQRNRRLGEGVAVLLAVALMAPLAARDGKDPSQVKTTASVADEGTGHLIPLPPPVGSEPSTAPPSTPRLNPTLGPVTAGPVTIGSEPPHHVPTPRGVDVVFVRNTRLYIAPSDGSPAKELSAGPGPFYEPSFSPDGSKLAVSVRQDDTTDVWVVDVATGARRRLMGVSGRQSLGAQWSPNGRRVAFFTYDPVLGIVVPEPEVWTVDADGANAARLAVGTYPSWSSDGSRILYSCSQGLCIMNSDGSGSAVVPNSEVLSRGAWAPNGAWIAAADAQGNLVRIRPDGSDRRLIIGNASAFSTPAWYGNSRRLAYQHVPDSTAGCGTAECDQRYGIFTVDVDGSDNRQITGEVDDKSPTVRTR